MKVIGGLMSYKGIREEGYAQESLAKQQAGLYEGQAAREKEVGLENLRDMREEERTDLGTSRARAAKAGVRTGTGSALGAEKKISRIHRRNRERYGNRVADRIHALETQAHFKRREARSIRKSSRTRGLGSLLGSGYQTAKMASEFDWPKYLGA
jgi:hypothetical protein